MKSINIDDDLYAYLASQTKQIGESASDILRRLLMPETMPEPAAESQELQPTIMQVPATEPSSAPQPVENAESTASADVFALLSASKLAEQKSRVEKFLFILSALHRAHGEGFNQILSVKGRNRLYFATSKDELLQAGSSTNPKQIPDSTFWVTTNNNTGKKVSMLGEVAGVLGYNEQDKQKLTDAFES